MNNGETKAVAGGGPEAVAARPLSPTAANEAVIREVSSWDGVAVREHRFGGVEFRVGRRELGHLHARFADLAFPRNVRDELVASGRARPHHFLPESGWVTVPMRTATEVAGAIELFRKNYERVARAAP
ncbi:MAG: luciferase family protein [Terriglobia bacterium]